MIPSTPVTPGWCPFAKPYPIDHFNVGTLAQRNTIIPHITEGTTADGAISTFLHSTGKDSVSSHFIVDRDGTLTQLVSIFNTAWHASQANVHSVGIEHVALSAQGARDLNLRYADKIKAGIYKPWSYMPATDAQYITSARLINWLVLLMNIPIDRNHIRTHNEASPRDGHVQCCTGALDPDKLVALAAAMEPAVLIS